jgi:hypothetical protein
MYNCQKLWSINVPIPQGFEEKLVCNPSIEINVFSFCRCLKQLGNNHGSLVSILVPELLSTHPFFMGKEPDVDDPACILGGRERRTEGWGWG